MKLLNTISLLIFSLFILGCASSGGSEVTEAENAGESAASEDSSGTMTDKTAYEGSTGTGLLMERYKSGQIQGYRE